MGWVDHVSRNPDRPLLRLLEEAGAPLRLLGVSLPLRLLLWPIAEWILKSANPPDTWPALVPEELADGRRPEASCESPPGALSRSGQLQFRASRVQF